MENLFDPVSSHTTSQPQKPSVGCFRVVREEDNLRTTGPYFVHAIPYWTLVGLGFPLHYKLITDHGACSGMPFSADSYHRHRLV